MARTVYSHQYSRLWCTSAPGSIVKRRSIITLQIHQKHFANFMSGKSNKLPFYLFIANGKEPSFHRITFKHFFYSHLIFYKHVSLYFNLWPFLPHRVLCKCHKCGHQNGWTQSGWIGTPLEMSSPLCAEIQSSGSYLSRHKAIVGYPWPNSTLSVARITAHSA